MRPERHRRYCRSMRCWRAASARKRSMHSGFERPRGALQGVIAHQARASKPVPSHAFLAGPAVLAGPADLATALGVCTLGVGGRAVRWRSRGTARAACGEAAVDRFGAVETVSPATPGSAPDACCGSGFTQSATGAIADGVVGASAGIGASADVATTFVVVAIDASGVETGSPEGGNDGRSSVQAPQPSATMPVNASKTAALR